ncbi:hypothetical protein ACS0TY_002844 [Phlomoides rotata]
MELTPQIWTVGIQMRLFRMSRFGTMMTCPQRMMLLCVPFTGIQSKLTHPFHRHPTLPFLGKFGGGWVEGAAGADEHPCWINS